MTIQVLVTYGSKHGAAAESAEKIGEGLGEAGMTADVFPGKQVDDTLKVSTS